MLIFQYLKRVVIRHPRCSAFMTIFSIMILLNFSQPHPFVFYYDSGGYWQLSEGFIKEGIFSLTNYDNPTRGYLFPLIIFVIRKLASIVDISDYAVYEVVMSLVYTAFLAIIIPYIVQKLFAIKTDFLQINIFSVLALLFWKGSFFYPLTDLLAFFSMLLGAYVIIKFHGRWWQIVIASLFWGGASLIRPIYAGTIPFFILWALYFYHKQNPLFGWRVFALRFTALFLGFSIVFAPQLIINRANWEKTSPFVLTTVNGPSLFMKQLIYGIAIQKYETNVGGAYPSAPVFYFDEQGEGILIKSGNQINYSDWANLVAPLPITALEFFKLILSYPVDFLTIYARHLFNGLDVVYNSTYVENVYGNNLVIRLLNYSLWFLVINSILYFLKIKAQNFLNYKYLLLGIFSLPSVMSIPTAIEVRFMLPLHMLAYALIAFWVLPNFLSKKMEWKAQTLRMLFLPYIAFIVFCFILSANTYAGLQYGPYTFTGN